MRSPRAKRVDLKAILSNPVLRRELMVSTIQAIQLREGIETSRDQADQAYSAVRKLLRDQLEGR